MTLTFCFSLGVQQNSECDSVTVIFQQHLNSFKLNLFSVQRGLYWSALHLLLRI